MHEVIFQGAPPAIRRVAGVFKEVVKVFECNDTDDLISQIKTYPMDLFLIAQADNAGVVERYFLIGLAVPTRTDLFISPMVFFAQVPDNQYKQMEEKIKLYARKTSEVGNAGPLRERNRKKIRR